MMMLLEQAITFLFFCRSRQDKEYQEYLYCRGQEDEKHRSCALWISLLFPQIATAANSPGEALRTISGTYLWHLLVLVVAQLGKQKIVKGGIRIASLSGKDHELPQYPSGPPRQRSGPMDIEVDRARCRDGGNDHTTTNLKMTTSHFTIDRQEVTAPAGQLDISCSNAVKTSCHYLPVLVQFEFPARHHKNKITNKLEQSSSSSKSL